MLPVFLLCGCAESPVSGVASDREISSLTGVSLAIDSVTPTGSVYTLTNDTDTPVQCSTGADCFLETEVKGEWREVMEKGEYNPVTMELYYCTREKPLTQSADWTERYGPLPTGRYRLLKYVWLEDGAWLAAEFSVK